MKTLTSGIANLSHLGIIRVSGPDARAFLHAQLTQDFQSLKPSSACFAAYCSPQGRVLASFAAVCWDEETFLLLASLDLIETTIKRLRTFVLRAEVNIIDESTKYRGYGLVGESVDTWSHIDNPAPFMAEITTDGVLIHLYPAGTQRRAFFVHSVSTTPLFPSLSVNDWIYSEVVAGVARISSATSGLFLPQMLNYESIGGVSFQKGCYPGQEVVARSQFRGQIKRRSWIGHALQILQDGDEVFDLRNPKEPCGTVVQACPADDGGAWAIVCIQNDAAQAGDLRVKSINGAVLTLQAMPYPLVEI